MKKEGKEKRKIRRQTKKEKHKMDKKIEDRRKDFASFEPASWYHSFECSSTAKER